MENRKKILIIGGGLTGLTAGIKLVESGNDVTIVEKNDYLGGLAAGFKNQKWKWNLEHHYHHVFATDESVRELGNKVGAPVVLSEANTSVWNGEQLSKFDTPLAVLKYYDLSLISKFRLMFGMGLFKILPDGKWLDRWTAKSMIINLIGQEVWNKIWGPLFVGKFHQFSDQVNGSWFWARIKARTQKLGYFEGGFSALIDRCGKEFENHGGEVYLKSEVNSIAVKGDKIHVDRDGKKEIYDQVLITLPALQAKRITDHDYPAVPGLAACTLILELNTPLLKDIYWLNILDSNYPFLALVEHTNWQDNKHYGNKHVVYLGKYIPVDDPLMKMDAKEIIKLYLPYIKKINKEFSVKSINNSWVFKANYAQPVFPLNHSKNIPSMVLAKGKIYWSSMDHVYPWDRGTNFAVKWGEKVAQLMLDNK